MIPAIVTSADATTGEVAFPSLSCTLQVAVSPGEVASPEPTSNVGSVPTKLYANPSLKNW